MGSGESLAWRRGLAILLLLPALVVPPALAGERALHLLAMNDVYRIGGVEQGKRGGMARLRTLRQRLAQDHPDLLLLHAGDLLYPSLLSRRYHGEQMIDLLNRLDGEPGEFDGRLILTFGNHEFDQDRLRDAPRLQARIRQSEFNWLASNIRFTADEAGAPLIAADQLLPHWLEKVNGIRVGIFSITSDVKHPAYIDAFEGPLETARSLTRGLRKEGAELVIALTHQNAEADAAVLRALGREGPDLIVGGHEHHRMAERIDGRLLIKADSDLRSTALVHVTLDEQGGVRSDYRFIELDETVPPEPVSAERIAHWHIRFEREMCQETGKGAKCLSQELSRPAMPLIGEELEIRRFETNLGNWVVDQALEHVREQGARIAFINAGALRLNQDIAAGEPITERHLAELFAYPMPLSLFPVNGSDLKRALGHAVSDWQGNGWFLQIAGFAYRFDPASGAVSDLTLLTPDGGRPITDDEILLAVANDFLLEPETGQDGFTMLQPEWRRPVEADLRALVRSALKEAGESGIEPRLEGRICNAKRPGPCLAIRR